MVEKSPVPLTLMSFLPLGQLLEEVMMETSPAPLTYMYVLHLTQSTFRCGEDEKILALEFFLFFYELIELNSVGEGNGTISLLSYGYWELVPMSIPFLFMRLHAI